MFSFAINIVILKIFELMIKGHHILLLSLLIISCEKDDICIEGSENTNRVTISFIDNETKSPKGITLINVKSIENDSIIHEEFTGGSIKLPLKVNSNKTKFLFDIKETLDTLIIYHQTILQNLKRFLG